MIKCFYCCRLFVACSLLVCALLVSFFIYIPISEFVKLSKINPSQPPTFTGYPATVTYKKPYSCKVTVKDPVLTAAEATPVVVNGCGSAKAFKGHRM